MAATQAMIYAPQYGDMTVESVQFQSNNFVGNFSYPQSVRAYKEICEFLMNCPLTVAFTKTPLTLYQNYLREFWCTVVVEDPNPPEDDYEVRPFKEFIIKFTVKNDKKPLTLDYNKGNYIAHPSPRVVKAELAKIATNEALDPSKVTLIELTASMIEVINLESSVTPLLYSKKKKKSQTVSQPKPKTQVPEASGALPQPRKNTKPKTISLVQVTVTPPSETTEDSNKTQSVSSGQTTYPYDTKGNTQPAVKGSHSLLREGTRKSKPFPENSEDELKDDSDDDVFEAGEEMDEDIQEPDHDETQTHPSIETPTEEPLSTEHQSPSPNKEKPESSKEKKIDASDSKSSSCSETFKPYDNYMPITERKLEANASYADMKWSIDEFHSTTFRQYENTDAALINYQQILNLFKTNHNIGIKRMLDNLQEVQNAVKEDPALNKKILEVAEAYTKNSTNLIELLTLDNLSLLPQAVPTDETPSQTKGEKVDMKTKEKEPEVANENEPVQEPQVSEPIPFTIVRPLTKNAPEVEMIRALSRLQLIDTILEVRQDPDAPFIKKQKVELNVLNKERLEKLAKAKELRKKRIDQHKWTTSSRLKPEAITNIHIHPNKKPVIITVYIDNDRRNFNIYNPFKFGDFEVTEFDELASEQVPSQISGRKRNVQELEPEAFQRISDIHKVDVETLLSYMVMSSNVNTPANQRLCIVLRSLIDNHPDKEKLKSKKVKFEVVGYSLD
ncbi:hypothetical protein Tco_1027593 [Tanacetum coccineum]